MTTRRNASLHSTQTTYFTARALYESTRDAISAETVEIRARQNAAFDSDDDATATACEAEIMAVEKAYDFDGIKATLRAAEDLMVAWSVRCALTLATTAAQRDAINDVVKAAEKRVNVREKLVDMAARLDARTAPRLAA